jgi:perosamine synthetase
MGFRTPLCRVETGATERDHLDEVLTSGEVSHGRFNHLLSQRLSRLVGAPEVCLTSSGYAALHAALSCMGVTGEVIVPSFTFVATVNAVHLVGATPVFADVDPVTRNMTVRTIRAVATPRTRAIVLVHFAGQLCDMDPIMAFARERGIPVVEDCAQALGATYQGRPAGSFGVGCFSFFATKSMTTGEGGCVTTSDAELAGRIRRFIGHGVERDPQVPWRRDCVRPGMNFRMSNLAAAVGVAQFDRLDQFVLARTRVAARYDARLAGVPGVEVPVVLPGNRHCYQMYTICVPPRLRDALVRTLRDGGIEASVHFDPPVHRQSWYRQTAGEPDLPGTDQLAATIVSLPMFSAMRDEDVDDVSDAVARFIRVREG